MKFSIKDFYSDCDYIGGNCGFGPIYWRNLSWKTSFFAQWEFNAKKIKSSQKKETFNIVTSIKNRR